MMHLCKVDKIIVLIRYSGYFTCRKYPTRYFEIIYHNFQFLEWSVMGSELKNKISA